MLVSELYAGIDLQDLPDLAMYCRVCGDLKNVSFARRIGKPLCAYCAKGIPEKVTRDEFEERFWGEELKNVPASTRGEFYEEYLLSTYTVDEYIDQTRSYT